MNIPLLNDTRINVRYVKLTYDIKVFFGVLTLRELYSVVHIYLVYYKKKFPFLF